MVLYGSDLPQYLTYEPGNIDSNWKTCIADVILSFLYRSSIWAYCAVSHLESVSFLLV